MSVPDIQNGHISVLQPPLQLSSISSAFCSWVTFSLNSSGLTLLPYYCVFYVTSLLEQKYVWFIIKELISFGDISENCLRMATHPVMNSNCLCPWHFAKRKESVSKKWSKRRKAKQKWRYENPDRKYVSWLKRNEVIKTKRQIEKQNESQRNLKLKHRVPD